MEEVVNKLRWYKSESNLWLFEYDGGERAAIYRDGLTYDYEIYGTQYPGNALFGYFGPRKAKSFKDAIRLVNKIIIKEIDKEIKDLNKIKKLLSKK